ncbi:MAG: site-specific integrase, partial [Eubacterium sp.]|nr:site-specific integrase [Eubacterium sp.]
VMEQLGMKHRPHDTRHTFITLAKEDGMDEYVLKLIVGHVIADLTEKVYTHRTAEQLHAEMKKLRIRKCNA